MNNLTQPNWHPFKVAPPGQKGDLPRSLSTLEGIGDRLRSAAFAELQAKTAFLWATDQFHTTAPQSLIQTWIHLAQQEEKHLQWLLMRLEELGLNVQERFVSDLLWYSFQNCKTAKDFSLYMAHAEDRGRKAGERFYKELLPLDPKTAEIFRQIAKEELEHILVVFKFYPDEARNIKLNTMLNMDKTIMDVKTPRLN